MTMAMRSLSSAPGVGKLSIVALVTVLGGFSAVPTAGAEDNPVPVEAPPDLHGHPSAAPSPSDSAEAPAKEAAADDGNARLPSGLPPSAPDDVAESVDFAEESDDEVVDMDAELTKVKAPEDPAMWWGAEYSRIDRGINVPLAYTTRPLHFLIQVNHRNHQPFLEDTFYSLGGFDFGSLKIGLGLRFGIIEDLDIGAYRLSGGNTQLFDTYEFDIKWRFLTEEKHYLSLAVRGGVDWFSQKGHKDALWPWGQLIVSRRLWDRLILSTGFMYHPDSSAEGKRPSDTDWSAAVPIFAEVRILSWLAWNAEVIFNVAGYRRGVSPQWSSGVRFITNRHHYLLLISNSQFDTADGMVSNSERRFQDFVIGFSIYREIDIQ